MSKTKKILPELRFPEFSNNETWADRKLSDVLFEHKEKSTGNEEVYSVSVHKGVVNQVEHLGRVFAASNTENYKRVLPGDIIYTKSPTGDFPFGIIKQSKVSKPVIVSPLYGVFKPETTDLGVILDAYFEYPERTINYLSSIVQKGAKNTINIHNDTFLSKSLVLPFDKKEQRKIAAFLLSIDDLIAAHNEKLELLKDHKKGLMQNLFPQKGEKVPNFRFKEFKKNGRWKKFIFSQAFERITRKNIHNHQNVLTISAQQGLISQELYFNKKIASNDITNYYLIKKGEFAYNKSYSKEYPKGAIKLLKKYDLGVVSTLYICFKCKEGFYNEYFKHFFESGIFNEQIDKIAQEGARDHGLLNVSVIDFFDRLEVIQPPTKEEQQKIVSCLSILDDLIMAQAEKLEQLKQHKKGLMQRLFPKVID